MNQQHDAKKQQLEMAEYSLATISGKTTTPV
jgi:hypothetical protein